MHGWYGIKFWWQLSSSDQSWELLRSSDSLGVLVSGNQGPGLPQEIVKLKMQWPKKFFPKTAFFVMQKLHQNKRQATSPKKGTNPSKCSQMALCGCWNGLHEIRHAFQVSVLWGSIIGLGEHQSREPEPLFRLRDLTRHKLDSKANKSKKTWKFSISFNGWLYFAPLLLSLGWPQFISVVFAGEITEPTLVEGDGKGLGVAIKAPLP